MFKSKKLWAFIVVGILLGTYVQILLQDAGFYREVLGVHFGQCEKKGDLLGPEDMVTLKNNQVIVSADPRDGGEGGLYSYDLVKKEMQKLSLEPALAAGFHPHGIDLFETTDKSFLYVVNHRTEEETVVEVFEVRDGKVIHLKTLQDPHFQSANDIAAVGVDQFYITSDFGTPHKRIQKVTQYMRHATGYVSYFDGTKAQIVIPGVFYANGVALDHQSNTLFVAGMLAKEVSAYQLGGAKPVKIKTIKVDGGPDNIAWSQGKLFVAAHAKLISLKQESEDRSKKAPSQIIAISNVLSEKPESKVIYANSGDEISSASFALPVGDSRILIGSVFDGHILDCTR